jgi:hypothetical protein
MSDNKLRQLLRRIENLRADCLETAGALEDAYTNIDDFLHGEGEEKALPESIVRNASVACEEGAGILEAAADLLRDLTDILVRKSCP